jgi:hypothetical protein
MRRLRLVLIAAACLALLLTAGSAPAQRADDCTWGASSIVVQDVNGRMVESEPAASGCVPPR